MSPEEANLALRDLVTGVLRSVFTHSGTAFLKLEPKVEMADVSTGVLFPIQDMVYRMEMGYSRGTIPAPAAAKEQVSAALAKINPVLEQVCKELFTNE
ncbi:MAG: hypothetical protein V4486_00335 [Patescibacteria group bacterium]